MALRIYRTLLLVLPGWFREEFSREMTAVFRDTLTDARRDGFGATASLWNRTVGDLLTLSLRLHADAARQDVTYAWRTLRRTPTFTLAAIATLALGLGPALVIVNLVHHVVLRPLPFSDADRLVSVWNAQPEKDRHEFPLSTPDYIDFRDQQSMFEALAAHAGTSVAFLGAGEPRQVAGVLTTSELFRALQVQPVLGRALTPADSAPGAAPVIVIGADFWRSEFGARQDVVGQTVKIDGTATEIVGVLPGGVDFPTGSRAFWVPLTLDPAMANRGSHFLNATGRLKEGVTVAQASDVLNRIARTLAEQFPSTNGGNAVEVIGLKQQLNGDAPRMISVLAVAIAAVLLIACTNVASLLTVRASIRGTELAVRTAVGATARRLRRQLLVEHFLLALSGALVAGVIAVPMHRLLVEHRLLALPRTAPLSISWTSFAALAVLVVAIGALFSRTTRRSITSPATLVGSARYTGERSQLRLRQGLVVAEVAAALALVVVAALMVRSGVRLSSVDPGFRTDNLVTFGVVLPASNYGEPALRQQFVERVLAKLRELPGVRSAASAGYAPMGPMRATRRFAPEDRPMAAAGSESLALDMPVGPGYFDVMGIPVIEGRPINERDSATAPPVLVVSETFAREVFPGQSAIGKRIGFYASRPGSPPPPSREIVGVVGDVRQDGISTRPIAQMYSPYAQAAWGFTSFFVRVDNYAAATAATMQRAVSSIDPMRPVRDVKTAVEIVRASTARQRAMTGMLLALAVTALLLATVGLYGVSATATSARSRELAIRAAVGADPSALVRLVLRQGVLTGALGIALGTAASMGATLGIEAFLFETQPRDPAVFTTTVILLMGIALMASYLPARRALRTNPAEVLRAE